MVRMIIDADKPGALERFAALPPILGGPAIITGSPSNTAPFFEMFPGLQGGGAANAPGLSLSAFNVSGEIERARLDLFERERRITDSRKKSTLTLPNILGDGEAAPKLLADVL
ncbi:MAG: hypothetical protein V3W44_04360 [Dehalococcoidales bacterium]